MKTPPITFVIVTAGEDVERTRECIRSIEWMCIPKYEILVIGPCRDYGTGNNVRVNYIYTDDDMWITTKKNIGAKVAKYDNLVLMHDYFVFESRWYENFCNFDENVRWDIASCPQYLMNGKRHFTDWIIWDHPVLQKYTSLDYYDWTKTKHQYLSGGFIICKRNVLLAEPFNENMKPGQPEDVEWSLRVRDKYEIRCMPKCTVMHNKKHRDCH